MDNLCYIFKALVNRSLFWQQAVKTTYCLLTVIALVAMPALLTEQHNPLFLAFSLYSSAILIVILPLEAAISLDQQTGWLTWYMANYDDAYSYFTAKLVTLAIYQLVPLSLWLLLLLPLSGLSWLMSLVVLQAVIATAVITLSWGSLLLLVLSQAQSKSLLILFILLPFLLPIILISYQQLTDMLFDGQWHYFGYQWGLTGIALAATIAFAPLVLKNTEA